jgi:copper chaperone CopZ
VRSALLSVKGVTRARVSLENHEALVDYDAAQATIEDMAKAVASAVGPLGQQYSATVKGTKSPP